MVVVLVSISLLVLLALVTRFYLTGEDLSEFQNPRPDIVNQGVTPSEGHAAVAAMLATPLSGKATSKRRTEEAGANKPHKKTKLGKIQLMRTRLDRLGKNVEFDGDIIPVDNNGIKGEWLIPANADPQSRMLYLHGGAFMLGSSLSHRAITTQYAQLIGGPVFSLDYRLMPEHRRQASIDDCRAAYQWVLEQGPEGSCPVKNLYISGDSAGGNLSLALSIWIRDSGLRPPEAIIALSPMTDSTFASPSFVNNVSTDTMLGPILGAVAKTPRSLLLWFSVFSNRRRPSNHSVSPLHADLAELPPTLVHASSSEMLLDDAVRYVNKACAAGSPASIQVWQGMIHVWHIFVATVPEAQQAFAEIEIFLHKHKNA